MTLMGLNPGVNWVSWLIRTGLITSVSTIISTIFLHFSDADGLALIQYSDPMITFLFLFLYMTSMLVFAFVMSTIFAKGENLE